MMKTVTACMLALLLTGGSLAHIQGPVGFDHGPWVGTSYVQLQDANRQYVLTYYCYEGSLTEEIEVCFAFQRFPHDEEDHIACSIELELTTRTPGGFDEGGEILIKIGRQNVTFRDHSLTGKDSSDDQMKDYFRARIVHADAVANTSDDVSRGNYASLLYGTEMEVMYKLSDNGPKRIILPLTGLRVLAKGYMGTCNAPLQRDFD
ncbi:MAG: hypothetical protein ACE363_12405 [Alphaproteobacteria bacterium]